MQKRERFWFDFYALVFTMCATSFTYIFDLFKIQYDVCKSENDSDIYKCFIDFTESSTWIFLKVFSLFIIVIIITELSFSLKDYFQKKHKKIELTNPEEDLKTPVATNTDVFLSVILVVVVTFLFAYFRKYVRNNRINNFMDFK